MSFDSTGMSSIAPDLMIRASTFSFFSCRIPLISIQSRLPYFSRSLSCFIDVSNSFFNCFRSFDKSSFLFSNSVLAYRRFSVVCLKFSN